MRSKSRDTRLKALIRIRKQIEARGLRTGYFNLVKPLTTDSDSNCRWQATIIIGEFIDKEPDRVWRIARELGASTKSDIRAAATTVLLEHLLEYHPKTMIPLFRRELARGDARFANAVAGCWNFGHSTSDERRIARLIQEAEKESDSS